MVRLVAPIPMCTPFMSNFTRKQPLRSLTPRGQSIAAWYKCPTLVQHPNAFFHQASKCLRHQNVTSNTISIFYFGNTNLLQVPIALAGELRLVVRIPHTTWSRARGLCKLNIILIRRHTEYVSIWKSMASLCVRARRARVARAKTTKTA